MNDLDLTVDAPNQLTNLPNILIIYCKDQNFNISYFVGYVSLFRRPIAPTAHYSDGPLFRQPIIPTTHCSDHKYMYTYI